MDLEISRKMCVLLRFFLFVFRYAFLYFTERWPWELRENSLTSSKPKKCCLLIFAIAIGCLVLADFPATKSPPFFVHYPEYYSGHPCVPATCCVFASGLANNLVPILSSRSPSYWLSCSAGSPKRSWRFGVHFAVPPARIPPTSTPYSLRPPLKKSP